MKHPPHPQQADRAWLDQLIGATRLYDSSEAVNELFDFVVKLRTFAPFNGMLLHIQKPGLTHAATAHDWRHRFHREPRSDARPLVVLRAMGPVDFVFDILDTEGDDLPLDAFSFPTLGSLSKDRFEAILMSVSGDGIKIEKNAHGDASAGSIKLRSRSDKPKGKNTYTLAFNSNHPPPTCFVTVAHELAHVYLGHLGSDSGRRVRDRCYVGHDQREVEAECTAYLVAKRNGLTPRSESYLANHQSGFESLDLYTITRAANAVETAMGISAHRLWKISCGRRRGNP